MAVTPVRTLLCAPIRFDTDGGRSHAPMVLATIGSINTRLILDTGSDVHLLTTELAEAAGLALRNVDSGTDHSGTTMDSWIVGGALVHFEGATGDADLTLRDVVAIPAPAAFSAQGIGGILSPQRLHQSAFVVIDQVDDELALVEGHADAIEPWLAERHHTPDILALPRRRGDARPIVEAAIEPHPAVPVLVNTGGRHTEFEPASLPGLAAGGLEQIGTGVSGAPVLGASAGPQVLSIGDARIALPSVMLREGMGDPPAMLGQDVLRGTVVALAGDTTAPVMWQVPRVRQEADVTSISASGSV